MNKGERVSSSPIGSMLLRVNLTIGVLVEKVLNNLFAMDPIEDQNLNQCLIKQINQKKFFSALVNKQRILLYVMDLIIKNENDISSF